MSTLRLGRRHFLVGAAGFTVAIPLLGSLLPQHAEAQATGSGPRFVGWGTKHGAIRKDNMFPADATLTERSAIYSDHSVQRGALRPTVDGGRASLSPVLSASSSVLTPQLASKLNVLRGLDVPCYLAHHTGGQLGAFAQNTNADLVGRFPQLSTIDQLMAYSSSFYPDLSGVRERSIHLGELSSYGFSNPAARTGDIVPLPSTESATELFSRLFGGSPAGPSTRTPVVDRVLEHYRQLRGGAFGDARRLSTTDRRRLDEHIERLAELDRHLGVRIDCGTVTPPAADVSGALRYSDPVAYWRTMNDLTVAALSCGVTRIVTMHSDEIYVPFEGDWHEDVAHQAAQPGPQALVRDSNQQFFERAFLDLAAKLDLVDDGDGRTVLDNTLMMWSQEAGSITHEAISVPVVTAGGAGGRMSTGSYVDYSNRDNLTFEAPWPGREMSAGILSPGLLYTRWLATALQAVGIAPAEFETGGTRGYGGDYRSDAALGPLCWPDRIFADASNALPFLMP